MPATPGIAARPIGVFDSGLGGLTVVRQIAALMPGEDVVYLGDSARVPYGIKSPETVRQFALEVATFLLRFEPKIMVVACNTASAVAMDVLAGRLPVPVVGVVRPAAAEAVRLAAGGIIGVIGTEGTIASCAYQRAIAECDPASQVLAAHCPLLVPIVEEGRTLDDPIVLYVLADYLATLQRARPNVLVMGCTHYPLLAEAVRKLMGPQTLLVDPGVSTAQRVRAELAERSLLTRRRRGQLRCFSTDNAERFSRLAERFLGRPVGKVAWVGTDELTGGGAIPS